MSETETKVIDRTDESSKVDLDELMRKYDTEARFRTLSGWQGKMIAVLAVAMSCFHFYTSGFGLLLAQKQGAVHLAFTLALVFLLYPASSKQSKTSGIPFYDFIFAAFGVASAMYLVVFFNDLVTRAGLPTRADLVMGFILIVTLLEATRRISNPILPGLAIVALLYCYFGRYMPAVIAHRGFNVARIVNHMYLGTEGIFGTPLEVSSTFVFMFILFGAVLEKTGLGKFIIDLSLSLAGWSTGGPAKVAVVSSGLMGTVSGSSVANVCTTGMFTIPLMKSVGYEPHFAGAVEAVASTGGQIMPPVMGAAAFIMAQILGIPYIEVAIAAVVPALLYYFAVMVQVHFEACRLGLKGIPWSQLPPIWPLLRSKGFLLIPLIAIIYFLLAGYTPLKAAFNGILISFVLSWLNKETRLTPLRTFEAFQSGARGAIGVACACATVGMVVGMGTLTGLALRIAGAIVSLAKVTPESGLAVALSSIVSLLPGATMAAEAAAAALTKVFTLFFTMIASLILGMGLPTTANFIVTSTMAAPALFLLGVPPMAAYMFVFYFGIAADLTPPVALAAYAGSGIAGSDPMKTGVTAFKLALAGFLVPYIYVYSPMLLFIDVVPIEMVQAIGTALIGVFLLAMFTIGFFKAHMAFYMRIIAFIGALGLMIPGTASDIFGLAVLALIFVVQTAKARMKAKAA
ncbi:TRAP transporter permease [Synergistes jonesii]|uniref:C4-dicarboxylate ABC transporter permease n=1 Tax=Synergistes jonesii TaxID=2754 RepID=A0A073IV88_9BACT|nr:TRAP transporter permease [Synergistes jonesii]KEJ93475.1 C4-dicarboxylate ABC transporter permease [Synergistes jonesii]OFB61458.1 C4-dicarboxylate ABC transporter permease [Synergistes jonesii]OFB65264.1 C4-dicarboxylate ABC transporter permease [Synergistes jonesii]OFB68614.1 C4-dicarboxylate ABC transporter permease [Synergistes jonesii]OFB69280.1 C4-dicarboxylate ABC transporter permease [Synergistes jonesii]